MTAKMYRQGDLLLEEFDESPSNRSPLMPVCGKWVLAYGEATGHAHSIDAASANFTKDERGDNWIEVTAVMTLLEHQEHTAIELPAGVYRVSRQREYSPEAVRNVSD